MDEYCGTESLRIERRWWALVVLQFGLAMTFVDGTIVDVALSSIRFDLDFSDASLAWIVNAYLLTFAGFLILSGRLGDVFGQRRVFLLGIAIFTIASLGCGLARSQTFLIVARAFQGLGGAIISAVSLSSTLNLFPKGPERTKAIALCGVIAAGGGSAGLLLGGTLTSLLSWHWIFWINIPIGVLVYMLGLALLPPDKTRLARERIHVSAALTLTVSLILVVHALLQANAVGWGSIQTVVPIAGAVAFAVVFLAVETASRAPLVPRQLLRRGDFSVASASLALLCTSMGAWYFFVTLYLQRVIGWNALEVGLAFLPANLAMGAFSLGLSATLVIRFGVRPPLAIGLLLTATGLSLFARTPAHVELMTDIVPGMLLVGLGGSMAWAPLLIAGMAHIPEADSGLASGVVNTAIAMGGTIGLTILVSIAEARTNRLLALGYGQIVALNGGYHTALLFGAGISAATSTCVLLLQRTPTSAN